MSWPILKVKIRSEHDIVLARQRARAIAELLGFDRGDQSRLATAVSEIARNAFQYAHGGDVEFLIDGNCKPQVFAVKISDRGRGIAHLDSVLEGRYRSTTGMGLGIVGAKRLMEVFHIESVPDQGTTVFLGRVIPDVVPLVEPERCAAITDALARQTPSDPFSEVQKQNQELLQLMDVLRLQKEQLEELNREVMDTNRGMVALHTELEDKAASLSKINDLKAQFLSNMSHEFRTPLNSILALAHLLLDCTDGPLTREQEKQVMFIRKAAEDLSVLVNDLLDLAKIEAGQTTVRVSEFDARDLFSSLRGMFKPLLLNPAVKLVFEEPSGAMALHTDEAKVAQILRNLVSNALKFTERGEVLVRAACQTENRAVEFTVADTGIGIAPEHQARIFQEFGQVESPLQRKLRGTGLGLPLSRRLAELLGGTLTVESQLGVGSTFRAVIPLVYTARAVSVPGAEAADVTQFPVLVIEDDAQMQDIYQAFLRGSGFHCLPAFSLKEARQVLAHTRPLAFILDILLPGENGWEFLSELKSQPATCDVPVLVVTVLEDRQHALMLRAADFCTKPVKRAWLLRKLREIATTAPVSTVLIVDDEEASRYLLKGALANTKYKLLEARGGVEGLQLAREHCPDVIFLDLVMPDLTGFEVLVQLRQDEHTRDIPVIVVTSKVLEAEELALLRESTAAIIPKSITTRDAMLAQIRSTLARLAGQTEKPRTFS